MESTGPGAGTGQGLCQPGVCVRRKEDRAAAQLGPQTSGETGADNESWTFFRKEVAEGNLSVLGAHSRNQNAQMGSFSGKFFKRPGFLFYCEANEYRLLIQLLALVRARATVLAADIPVRSIVRRPQRANVFRAL